jgi:hypothetical protein
MPTDFRALCVELTEALDNAVRVVHAEDGTQRISTAQPVLARARAALSGSTDLCGAFKEARRQSHFCGPAASVSAAVAVVLPDEPWQPELLDYSQLARLVERRAIKARFLELIDSLATKESDV